MGAKSTMDVANRLVDLCKQQKHREAIEELYADDAVAVEAMDGGGPFGREVKGKQQLLAASDWFENAVEMHGGEIDGPYPHDDEFVVFMSLDCTFKEGPMAGQRTEMKEACRYTVQDGKITRSQFYYAGGPDC